MIEVLAVSVPEIITACDLAVGSSDGAGLGRMVNVQDRAAAHRRRHRDDAQRVLAGRAGLRLLAARRLDLPASAGADLPIERHCHLCGGPHGQPRMAGLSLSSSTSRDRVLVAVAQQGNPAQGSGVGVDIEHVPEHLFDGFDEFALHPSARQGLPHGPAGISARIASWVEKEAVLKTVGIGLDSDPALLRIVGPDPAGTVDPVLLGQAPEAAGRPWRRVLEADRPELVGLVVTPLSDRSGCRSAVASTRSEAVHELGISDLVRDLPGGTPTPQRPGSAAG